MANEKYESPMIKEISIEPDESIMDDDEEGEGIPSMGVGGRW